MEFNVVVKLKIMPKDVEVDIEKIKEQLPAIINQYGKIHSLEIKPIAFGLNSLEVTLLLNDSQGGMEKIEEEISNLEEVGEVNVTDISRL